MDLLIAGGTLVTSAGEQRADLAVAEGRIALLGADLSDVKAKTVIDARGKLVLPGLIDGHLRLAEPTPSEIARCSQAAALGGFTTALTFAPIGSEDVPAEAVKAAAKSLDAGWAIDWGFHLELLTADCMWDVAAAFREGETTSVHIDLCPHVSGALIDDGGLLGLLRALSGHALAIVHCENGAVSHHLLRNMAVERGQGAESHAKAHPAWSEAEAIRRVAQLVGASGAQVMISAVTSREGLDALQWAKSHFPTITAATSPVHLTVGRDLLEKDDAHLWAMHPPLRAREAHRPLWQALDSGLLDAVVSLHRAVPREDKEAGKDDPVKAEPGWPGIETVLPMLWSDGVEKRRLTPQALAAVLSETPAKLFGLWPQKGSMEIGADADLVIFDPEKIEDVNAAKLHTGADYHPMDGRSLKGWPIATVLRGEVIARGGEFVGAAAGGQRPPRRFGLG